MKKIDDRIIGHINEHRGVMSPALLASDLKISLDTVSRRVAALKKAGRIETGWDGLSLELSDSERRDQQETADVKRIAAAATRKK